MRLKNIIWKTVVMSLMASPLCISCDDDDEVTMNSKFYLSTKVFPVDSYEASLSVILKDNSVVVNELQPILSVCCMCHGEIIERCENNSR